jgi:hypothetical protein
LVFIDACEDSIMADDVVMPSNPLIVSVEEEELHETSFDVNVSQRSCEKKSLKIMVSIQIDRSAWDRQLFLNPYALIIYLEFVPAHVIVPERFKNC